MIGLIKGTARQAKTVSGLPLPIASYKSNSKLPLKELSLSINPTQSGSGDPAPDNIRPITGVSSVNVADMSDNTDLSYFQGVLKGTHGVIVLDGNKTYGWSGGGNLLAYVGVSGGVVIDASTQSNIYTHNSNPNFNNASWVRRNADKPSIGMYYGASSLFIKSDDITSADEAKAYFTAHPTTVIYELATPTTPTIAPSEFEALLTEFGINGWCVNVQLGDTYYGGELDIDEDGNVKFRVLRGFNKLKDLTWTTQGGTAARFVGTLSVPIYFNSSDTSLMCSAYKTYPYNSTPADTTKIYVGGSTSVKIYDTNYPNASDLNDWLTAMGDETICYVLATPIEIDLGNLSIPSLLGQNHIWHDGNGDVEVLKFIDRQLYFGR